MKRVEWVKRDDPAGCPTAGWRLLVDDRYTGTVWLDGSFSACSMFDGPQDRGSRPLAAQALLRAAGVEP